MDYVYEGKLTRVEDEWYVSFDEFPGCGGGGATVDEACRDAAEALRLGIATAVEDGRIPKASVTGDGIVFCVEVDERYICRTACMTVSRAADELGISRGRVSQLLNLGRLDAAVIDGKRMVTIASVNARLSEDVKAGRPKA